MRELANEFPNIAKLMNLPNKTNGYQRKAQTMLGTAAVYTGASSASGPPTRPRRGRPDLEAWGHEGGNNLTAEIVNDGAPKGARGHGRRQRDHGHTPRPTPPARSPARPPRSSPRSTPTPAPPRS